MYICPTCGAEFSTEEKIRKHFLACWREKNPNHKSKDAPRSQNIETREVSNDIADFFKELQK